MTIPQNPHGVPTPGTLASRERLDSENIDRIAKAQAVISGLLGVIAALLVAGLILGIVGYNKVAERLDNIERSTGETAEAVENPPATVVP